MIGVLVSGNGTNLQALVDAGLPIAAVASNRRDAYALVRANEAGIPTATFALDCHASREERDLAMATWREELGGDRIVLAGYLHQRTTPLLDRLREASVALMLRSAHALACARLEACPTPPPSCETAARPVGTRACARSSASESNLMPIFSVS